MKHLHQHYHRDDLAGKILEILRVNGKGEIRRSDLAAVDEFHVRGAEITIELARQINLQTDSEVLDAGCGIGGAARYIADFFGCHVTGIDIIPEYVRTAAILSGLTGFAERNTFICGDALALPFADGKFDVVWTQHVQMNIAEKEIFYSELHRVLKQDGLFACYDIFSTGNHSLHFPLPWANHPEINHLFGVGEFHSLMTKLGFSLEQSRNQTNGGIQFMEKLLKRIEEDKVPAFSMKLVMGDAFRDKMENLHHCLVQKLVEIQSAVYRKVNR